MADTSPTEIPDDIKGVHYDKQETDSQILLQNSLVAAFVNVAISLLTFIAIPSASAVWLYCILAASLIRLFPRIILSTKRPQGLSINFFYWCIMVTIMLQGAAWGYSSFVLFSGANDLNRFFLIAIICGLVGGSILTLSPSLLAFCCYALPSVIPLVLVLLAETEKTFQYSGVMGIIFLLAVLLLARKISQTNRQLHSSQKQLQAASVHLAEHKERLEVLVEARTQELHQSRENYRRLTEEINDVIYELDNNLNITYISPAVITLLGYTPSELVGKSIGFLFKPEESQSNLRFFDSVLAGGHEPTEFQMVAKSTDCRWLRSSHLPIVTERQITGVRGVLTDIDGEKKANDEKATLLKKIHENQKLEAIGMLAGGIAHDFNNILSSILGFTELAIDEAKEGSNQKDYLQEVYKAGIRAKDLVIQILAFARQSDDSINPVAIADTVTEVLRLIRSTIPSTIAIKQTVESQSYVMGNATQLHQVLMNLCTNASHAMQEDGGLLHVTLKDIEIGDDNPRPDLQLEQGKYVELTVSDTGCGIEETILSKIFEPYFTTKGVGEGSGMGLAVVKGIIVSYGGEIAVASKPSEFTVFTIYLPAVDMTTPPETVAKESIRTGKEKILLVDDETSVVKMGSRMLAELGYSVTTSEDSGEALRLFRMDPQNYDLVITDMTMPGLTGDKLAREMKKSRADIPIILCTGYSSKIKDKSVEKLGADVLVAKPFSRSTISSAIRQALAKGKKTR